MAAKPYRPKMTAAEKKAYKERNFGAMGKTGGMGGKYGRKSENLSAKQLKAAGALKASKKREVDISETRREGNVTLGPGGKPLTGTVKLGGGKTAVYKGGKRVQAGPAAGMKSKKTSSGTRVTRTTTTRVSPSARGEGAGSARTTTSATANLSPSALKNLGRARGQAARGNQMAKNQAGTISKTGRPMSTPSYTTSKKPTGGSTTSSSTTSSSTTPPKNPKIGDIWKAKYANGKTYTRRYTADGWRVV